MGSNYGAECDAYFYLWEPYAPPKKSHISTTGLDGCAGAFIDWCWKPMDCYIAPSEWKKKEHMSEDMFCEQPEPNVSLKEADAKPAEPRDGYGSEKLGNKICSSFGTGKGGREKAPDSITFTDNMEIWRGDGPQTPSFTLVDECGLTLTKCDSPKLGSGEMVSMNYLNAFSSMKFKGKVRSDDVVVLVDSGASSCFISSSKVAELNLPCDNSVRRQIQLGNGVCHEQRGICRNVDLDLQGIQFTGDFLPFELGDVDVDVILGYSWLKTLGPVLTDWNNLTMKFQHGDSWVCLTGDPSLSGLPASLHAILAWRYLGVLVLGSISVLCSKQSPC